MSGVGFAPTAKLATTTLAAYPAVDLMFPGFGLGAMNFSHHHQPMLSDSHVAHPSNPLASYTQHAEPSPPYTATPTSHHSPDDHFEAPPPKRQKLTTPGPAEPTRTAVKRNASAMDTELDPAHTGPAPSRRRLSDGSTAENKAAAPANPAVTKSRRVRTGCLTCRERHLKCDEGLPDCNNCRKSNRDCKRGVRLNFIDTQVKTPPIIPRSLDWSGALPFLLFHTHNQY